MQVMEILSVVIASIALVLQGANEYQKVRDKKKKQKAFRFISRVLELVSRIESESIILIVSVKEKLSLKQDPFTWEEYEDLYSKVSALHVTIYELQVEIKEQVENDEELFGSYRWPLLDVVLKTSIGKMTAVTEWRSLIKFYTERQGTSVHGYECYKAVLENRHVPREWSWNRLTTVLPSLKEQDPQKLLTKPQFYSLTRADIVECLATSEKRIAELTQTEMELKNYYLDMFDISDLL
jgi:hypothetical protein